MLIPLHLVLNSVDFPSLSIFTLTKTFALIGRSVHKDFGRDDVAKRQEHLHELRISELLGQVINKQVAAFWPWRREEDNRRVTWEHKQGIPGESEADHNNKEK